ncbi:MAG: NIL domain-containing protein [Pseudomonadota bacterium]
MISQKIVLRFPRHLVDKPIVCTLVKRYDLDFNILKANVTPKEEGLLVLEIKGDNESFRQGMHYLENVGVWIQPLSQDILRNDDRCIHCGACISVCPSGALMLERNTMKVNFDNEKCIACELCIKACPPRAMEAHF